MANPTIKDIHHALSAVALPGINKSLVELRYLKHVEVSDEGCVILQVELRQPHNKHLEDIKAQILTEVNSQSGVAGVELQITAVEPAKKPKQEAPSNELLTGVRHILGIASGKGGVGKSTVTANLAIALSLKGLKVGIMDADIYGPSQVMMWNIQNPPIVNPDKTVYPVTATGGIRVISMAMFAESDKALIWRGPMVSQMIQNFISKVHWGELDVLLIDMPPGTGDIQLTLTQNGRLSGALIVTTPQDVSVLDAEKGLQMFDSVSVPVLGVAENMSYFICDSCDKKHYIFRTGGGERIARKLGLPFLGQIPMEAAVADGGDHGVPVTYSQPNSATGRAFIDLADSVYSQLELMSSNNSHGLGEYNFNWHDLPVEG